MRDYLGSVQSSRLGVYHPVQLGPSLKPCPGVYMRMDSEVYFKAYLDCTSEASWELSCQHTVKQAGNMQSSAIGSVLDSMPGSILQNILGGVLWSLHGVYLGASWKLTWEGTWEHRWECAMKLIWQLAFKLYAAWYILSSVQNHMHIIVFYSTHRSIAPHSATHQISCEFLFQKQYLYELRVA